RLPIPPRPLFRAIIQSVDLAKYCAKPLIYLVKSQISISPCAKGVLIVPQAFGRFNQKPEFAGFWPYKTHQSEIRAVTTALY
ncbi:MAG: hypothetical protein OIF38_16895, partial [Cellvibrionaceae bacterium]|nr:hypothetical protein [Cellvibrionaceae bacterium]